MIARAAERQLISDCDTLCVVNDYAVATLQARARLPGFGSIGGFCHACVDALRAMKVCVKAMGSFILAAARP